MSVVFDVDGVLIDTKEQVTEAYRRVGVTMPHGAWHRSWEDWLPQAAGNSVGRARALHKLKNSVYREVLRENPPKLLPAGVLARQLHDVDNVFAVTAGSRDAITAALTAAGLTIEVLGYELSAAMRQRAIASVSRFGTYVDDNDFLPPDGWSFVKYTGQTTQQLAEEILWIR